MLEGLPAGVAAESAKKTVAPAPVKPSQPVVEAKAAPTAVTEKAVSPSARPPSAERPAAVTAPRPSTRPTAAARGGPVQGQNAEVELPGGVKMSFTWVGAMNLWVGTYEATNAEFRAFRSGHNSGHNFNGARQPVVMVSYDDAVAFCDWLTERERSAGRLPAGYRYRLANGDEWTRFAQCGTNRTYPWGNSMPPTRGNYSNNISGYNFGASRTVNVENAGRNEWSLYGVGGNVWEWTSEEHGSFRVVRGGSWRDFGDPGVLCLEGRRSARPSGRRAIIGFRVLLGPAAGGG
jgi:formylglycine-generating enzyme required for sulfatase activity